MRIDKSEATKRSRLLVKQLSEGDLEWKPDVFNNLGWHYSAYSKCGRFRVSPLYERQPDKGYHALLNIPDKSGSGRWVGHGTTPLEAVEDARRLAREELELYAQCIDMKLVPKDAEVSTAIDTINAIAEVLERRGR